MYLLKKYFFTWWHILSESSCLSWGFEVPWKHNAIGAVKDDLKGSGQQELEDIGVPWGWDYNHSDFTNSTPTTGLKCVVL